MAAYWLLFAYFALGALIERPKLSRANSTGLALGFGALLVAALIGFRYEVGGDWRTYAMLFKRVHYATLEQALMMGSGERGSLNEGDPAFQLINWAAAQVGAELWLVNLICGCIFTWGLFRFAKVQARPWLAIVVAVPYLVIVVAMGYTRQAVSIGIIMAGLAAYFTGGSLLRFAAYVFVATLFHKTALIMLPLVGFGSKRSRLVNLLIIGAVTYLLYDFFLSSDLNQLIGNYITAGYQSQGAAVRIGMSVIPAILCIFKASAMNFTESERVVWRNMSLAAFGFASILFVLPSSTVVDRLALYIIPLQLAVYSRPDAFDSSGRVGPALVIVYAAVVEFAWFNLGTFATSWVPYRFYPLFG